MSYSNGLLERTNAISSGKDGKDGRDGIGFKMTSTGDFNIDDKILFNMGTQADVAEDSDYNSILKDAKSGVNKEYLNSKFLKKDKNNVYYDLRGYSIENSEVMNLNSMTPRTLTSKEYVDFRDDTKADKSELANKVDKQYIDQKLANKLDMTTMATQTIKSRLQIPYYDPSSSNETDVVNIKYLTEKYLNLETGGELQNNLIFNSFNASTRRQIYYLADPIYLHSACNKMYVDSRDNLKADSDKTMLLNGSQAMESDMKMGGHKITGLGDPTDNQDAVTKKFMTDNTTQSHPSPIGHQQQNVFDKVMSDHDYQLTDENDVELGDLVTFNNSLHKINKKAIDMKLLLDSQKKYYSSRFGINMFIYDIDYYTLIIEIFFPAEIDKDTIDISAVSSLQSVNKTITRINDNYCRTLVQVHKYQQHNNDYLFIDMVMKMKPKHPYISKLQCYIVMYGIKSYQSNVESSVYDALWYIENDKIVFNNQIDLNEQPISGVGDGKNNNDGVNYKQLNTLEATLLGKLGALQPKSYYNTIFEYFFDLLDPSKFIMSDSYGAVVSGLFGNLVFNPTKLLADFDPNKGFMTDFEINFNENVTGSDDWTMYIAFKNDYKPSDNKRIKINFVNGSSFEFPWVKVENNKLYLDYDLDVSYKQIRTAYIGKYLNLWYTKIGNQFRIGICNNGISIDKIFSGYTLNASSLQISSGYYIQRIGFSKTAYPINDKEYHKIQFLDKTKGVFFE